MTDRKKSFFEIIGDMLSSREERASDEKMPLSTAVDCAHVEITHAVKQAGQAAKHAIDSIGHATRAGADQV